MYWFYFSKNPIGVLDSIQKSYFVFLWVGARKSSLIPLVEWSLLVRTKKFGGWGIKNVYMFGQGLDAKHLLRSLFDFGL